jgi:hypothetical protein
MICIQGSGEVHDPQQERQDGRENDGVLDQTASSLAARVVSVVFHQGTIIVAVSLKEKVLGMPGYVKRAFTVPLAVT